jgi:hypothetical protein
MGTKSPIRLFNINTRITYTLRFRGTLHQGFGAGKYLIGIGDTASVVRYAWLESLKAQGQKPTAAPAPTTQYESVKAAGIGAEQTYNPASKSMNKEFNGNIYENGQGKCCFIQTPNIGTESTSAPPDVSTLPSGATRVATFHTHGADSHGVYDDEHFSPADIRNTGTRGVPFFLGTPQGVIRMYDPATQKITTFKETAP